MWWCALLGRLRQENHMNLGGRGYSEPRSRHCTLSSMGNSARLHLKKQKKKRKKERKKIFRTSPTTNSVHYRLVLMYDVCGV